MGAHLPFGLSLSNPFFPGGRREDGNKGLRQAQAERVWKQGVNVPGVGGR
jgi:hypothetical protein